LALLVFLLSACSRAPSPGSSMTGAPTARDAATRFMNAVKAQDLMAMGGVWGTDRGPARESLERSDLDRRLVLLQQCYDHDRFQILDESSTPEGERVVRVQITRGNVTRTPAFRVVQGPSNRWYVRDTDFATVQGQFCTPP
jgi:hypothetical protein